MLDQILKIYSTSGNYPELVSKLITLGVQSYTVQVSTGIILYRFANGENAIHQQNKIAREVADIFDKALTIQAVKDTQQGKTDYPTFMNDIAKAGVQFYEATFTGNKRVTYIGAGDSYEENIPI